VTPVNLHTLCGSTPLTATTSWTAPASKPAWFSSRYANVRLAALASRSPRQRQNGVPAVARMLIVRHTLRDGLHTDAQGRQTRHPHQPATPPPAPSKDRPSQTVDQIRRVIPLPERNYRPTTSAVIADRQRHFMRDRRSPPRARRPVVARPVAPPFRPGQSMWRQHAAALTAHPRRAFPPRTYWRRDGTHATDAEYLSVAAATIVGSLCADPGVMARWILPVP
jgi:hypothetical protein